MSEVGLERAVRTHKYSSIFSRKSGFNLLDTLGEKTHSGVSNK